jgi:enoyl-CoA hydratase
MVTGDSITGLEAVAEGWANRAFPADQLDAAVIEVASRIAALPPEVVQLNKRVVHRQMDHMGMRAGIRAGTELCAIGTHTRAMADFMAVAKEKGLTNALQQRDQPFNDYRTTQHTSGHQSADSGSSGAGSYGS